MWNKLSESFTLEFKIPKRIHHHYMLTYNGRDFEEIFETYGKKEMTMIKSKIAVEEAEWDKFTHTDFMLKNKYIILELGN